MFSCEVCGSTELIKQDGAFTCKGCGCQYTVEEVRKMMGNVGPTTPTNPVTATATTNELDNLYQIARRAKNDNNSENAAKYYEMIMIKDPTSWEAAFYQVYFRAMNCKIAEIESAAYSVANCEQSVLTLIKDYVEDEKQQQQAVKEVVERCKSIARMLFNGARNHYQGIDSSIRSNYIGELENRKSASRGILYQCGDYIDRIFCDKPEIAKHAAEAWKAGIDLDESILHSDRVDKYTEKVAKYDPTYRYNKKKASIEGEISSLKRQISEVSTRKEPSKAGPIVAGIICVLVGLLYLEIGEEAFGDDVGLVVGVIFLIIGIIALLAGASGKSAAQVQAEKTKKISELQGRIREKEEELRKLSK